MNEQVVGPAAEHTLETAFNLALTREQTGDYEGAEPLYSRFRSVTLAQHGEAHPAPLIALYHLYSIAHASGRRDEADSLLTLWRDGVDRFDDIDDESLADAMVRLSDVLFVQGRYDEAEALAVRSLEMQHRLFGDTHPAIGSTNNRLMWIVMGRKEFEQGERYARAGLAVNRQLYPGGHQELAYSLSGLAESLINQNRFEEAEPLLNEELALRRRLFGSAHPSIGRTLAVLGSLERRRNRFAEAEAWYLQAADVYRGLFGRDYLITLQHEQYVAAARQGAGDYTEAERILRRTYDVMLRDRGSDDRWTRDAADRMAALYEAWGRAEDAAVWRLRAEG